MLLDLPPTHVVRSPVIQLLDNIFRGLLLAATVGSYIPQYRALVRRKTFSGLSLGYLAFNAICGAEQFTLYSHLLIRATLGKTFDSRHGEVIHPPTVGNWLNFAQVAVVFFGSFGLMAIALYYPPRRIYDKPKIVVFYLLFFITGPLGVIGIFFPDFEHGWGVDGDHFISEILFGFHLYIFCLLTTISVLVASYLQFWLTRDNEWRPGTLSTQGLWIQSVVFALVAVSWTWRFQWPEFVLVPNPVAFPYGSLMFWYLSSGWAVVDNAFFAIGQGSLWWLIRGGNTNMDSQRQGRQDGRRQDVEGGEDRGLVIDESTSLLGDGERGDTQGREQEPV